MNDSYSLENYIKALEENLPIKFMDQETIRKYKKGLDFLKNIKTDEVILETNLIEGNEVVDFSFKIDKKFSEELSSTMEEEEFKKVTGDNAIWSKLDLFRESWILNEINDIWFEFDYKSMDGETVVPSFFIDASRIYADEKYKKYMGILIGHDNIDEINNNLKECINKLPKDIGLFQLGVMLSRNENTIRLFTNELTNKEVIEYLKNIGWTGNAEKLKELFILFDEFSDKQYIIDFNVSKGEISNKLGINFGLDINKKDSTSSFLNRLQDVKLCTKDKKEGINIWCNNNDDKFETSISHFKFSIDEDNHFAKVYLKLSPLKVEIEKILLDNKW